MPRINVLLTANLSAESAGKLKSADPALAIRCVADEALELSRLLRLKGPGHAEVVKLRGFLDEALSEAEVLFCYRLPQFGIATATRLKWIQFWSAGVDHHLTPELKATDIMLTSMSGVHAIPISEHILTFMLMFSRNMPGFARLQAEKRWRRPDLPELHEKTVSIVGLGNIGKQTARLAKAFGMRVYATSRSAEAGDTAGNVDKLYSSTNMLEMLGASDFVVLTLPYTKETEKLIGARELKAMKDSAYLINISRGPIIDEAPLIKALQDRIIAGAGLDVFEVEPLPVDSPLWSLPNVILTPHVAGSSERYEERATELFIGNLRRYLKGERLMNLVDRGRGY